MPSKVSRSSPATQTPNKRRPRPTSVSDTVASKAAEVLRLMVDEGKSTNAACQIVQLRWQAFMDWCEVDPLHAERYARARSRLLERMAEEMHQIADTPVEGVTITTKPDGGVEEKRADMIEHRRLQIETRKWLLARLMPQKYSERNITQLTGADGGPIQHSLAVQFVDATPTAAADGSDQAQG